MTDKHIYHVKPPLQLVYLLLTIFACTILGILLSMLVIAGIYGSDTLLQIGTISVQSPPEVISALKIFIVLGNTLSMFLAPAIFFAYLIVHDPEDYLKTNVNFNWLLIPLILVISFSFNPLMEFMINLNLKMSLPGFLKGLEEWMRSKEDENKRVVEAILKMNTTGEFITGLVIVAFLPAIAEELLFRGCLQTIFIRWTGNKHAAIWITAILFSALHMEFFGFLPRMVLGALLGYLVVWSGSIWTSVWAHLINNATAVIATYLYQHKTIKVNPDDEHIFNYTTYIISLIIVLFLLWVYRNIALSKKHIPHY